MKQNLEMPLSMWQDKAKQCCFAVDQTVKSSAESYFYNLIVTRSISQIILLINNGSDNLVFVVLSYVAKLAKQISKENSFVTQILSNFQSWCYTGQTFVRPNFSPFVSYVTKTIWFSIAQLLKYYFQSQAEATPMLQFLNHIPASYYKLSLLRYFIENIGIVDAEMGFIKFRTMVYRFQENIIPYICQTLLPFFYSTEETLKINELSELQQNLNVSQEKIKKIEALPISTDQQIQADHVLMLLRQIVDFNYNITYTEYENEQPIDTCLISFPDSVLDKLTNPEFLAAVFFIVNKISTIRQQNSYLGVGLQCLQKILQSRLTYVKEDKKIKFIQQAVSGLRELLRRCDQLSSLQLLEGILACNRKLLLNVELSYIKKATLHEINTHNSYNHYLNNITITITNIVARSQVKEDNQLLNEALELANKLLSSKGYRDEEVIDQTQTFFDQFAQGVISLYLSNLCQVNNIFISSRLLFLSENKSAVSSLFLPFKTLASYDYHHLFTSIIKILRSPFQNIYAVSNIMMLTSELVEKYYLERNCFMKPAKDEDVRILGEIVKILINIARESQIENNIYFQIGSIIFYEAVLIEFLTSFDVSNHMRIKNRVYKLMMFQNNWDEVSQDFNSEQTIMCLLLNLLKYFDFELSNIGAIQNHKSQHESKIEYVLDSVQKCIFKLKWGMKRDVFLKSSVFLQLCSYFDKLLTSFNKITNLRSRICKIVVTLTFDDVLDEYKERIDRMITLIKNQQVQCLLYDLIGIFDGIQTITIAKYFCNKLKKQLNLPLFFQNIYHQALQIHQEVTYRDVFRLAKNITLNKGLKVNQGKLVYEMLAIILPQLNKILPVIYTQKSIDYQVWGQGLVEIIQMFNGLIGSGHINVYVVDNCAEKYFCGYLINIFQILCLMSSQINELPRLQDLYLSSVVFMSKQILNYIFSSEIPYLTKMFGTVTLQVMILSARYMFMIIEGNRNTEDKLIKAIEAIKYLFSYLNNKVQMTHIPLRHNNIKQYLADHQNNIFQLLLTTFNFLLGNYRNNGSYLRIACKMVFEILRINQSIVTPLLSKLTIPNNKKNDFEQICTEYLKKDNEDNFIDFFKNWLKQSS